MTLECMTEVDGGQNHSRRSIQRAKVRMVAKSLTCVLKSSRIQAGVVLHRMTASQELQPSQPHSLVMMAFAVFCMPVLPTLILALFLYYSFQFPCSSSLYFVSSCYLAISSRGSFVIFKTEIAGPADAMVVTSVDSGMTDYSSSPGPSIFKVMPSTCACMPGVLGGEWRRACDVANPPMEWFLTFPLAVSFPPPAL